MLLLLLLVILNGARLGPRSHDSAMGVSEVKDLLLLFAMLQSPQPWVPHPSFARVGKHEPRPEPEGAEAFRPRKKPAPKQGLQARTLPQHDAFPRLKGTGFSPYINGHIHSRLSSSTERACRGPQGQVFVLGVTLGLRSHASAMGVSGVKTCPELVEGDLLFAQLRSARNWMPQSLP